MSMIEIHRKASKNCNTKYHEFLTRFKKYQQCVYGFVEGKEDPSFYRGFIDRIIPSDWGIEFWIAGNKKNIIDLYSLFDWSRFSKDQVVFFIDRDLSDLLSEKLPNDKNVYITDGYSIENSIVNRLTCERLFSEILGLHNIEKSEQDTILDLFDEQLHIFSVSMIPIMAYILYWKRSGDDPKLNNIDMKHLFVFDLGRIVEISQPNGEENYVKYIHSQCKIKLNCDIDISKIEQELNVSHDIIMLIRGKFLLWFLVNFSLHVYKNINIFSSRIKSSPKIHLTISLSNCVSVVGPRAPIPESLKKFIDSTIGHFIEKANKSG